LTVQNAEKPFGGWGSAPDSAGDLKALPDPLAGEEVALCPPTLALQASLLASPNPFTKICLCFTHLLTV